MTTTDMKCAYCDDEGWVCENHSDQPWGGGNNCCGGAGTPCKACNPSDDKSFPRYPKGTVEIWGVK